MTSYNQDSAINDARSAAQYIREQAQEAREDMFDDAAEVMESDAQDWDTIVSLISDGLFSEAYEFLWTLDTSSRDFASQNLMLFIRHASY